MNVAGPSRVATRERVESIHEQDLLAHLNQLGLDEMDETETVFDAGERLSDHDVTLAALYQDWILAERIVNGEDEFGLEFQRPPVVEAPRVARRRWALVSKIRQRFKVHSRTATRRNENQQPARNGAAPSQTRGGRFASVVGLVLGSHPASQSGPANSSTTASRTVNRPTGHDCVICQDPIYGVEIRAPCGHYYDIGCITNLFQSATRDETLYPPRCCRKNIPFARVRPHLPQVLLTTLQEKEAEFNTLNRIYCSSPTCNRFLGPLSKGIFARKVYTCRAPNCGRRTCGKCREERTSGWKHVCLADADTAQVLELSRASGWARCPGCSQMIELNMGCYHMTCRCRTEFCYLCRARWKTCECPQWDERRLLAVAEERVDAQFGGRGRAVRCDVPARRLTLRLPTRPQTPPQTPPRTPTNLFPSASVSVSTRSRSSSSSTSSFESRSSSSHGETRWPGTRRRRRVREMMERLRVDHECDHTQWRHRDGGGICERCGHYLRLYLLRCEGCEMLACNRCTRNRL